MGSNTKIAVITGAGSGIGKATALAFLRDGWSVALVGRRADALDAALDEAGPDASRGLAVPADVGNPESVAKLFTAVEHRFGRIDMLFNNAGQNAPGVPFEDLPYDKWKAVMDTNLTGSFLCAQAAFRMMKNQTPQGGRIINNGSISAHAPRPDSAPYTASKHGVSGLTRTISLDGRKYNIACCQVDVGNAMTELAARMSKGVKQADGAIKVEPMINVTDVAKSVLFMANQPLDVNIYHLMVMATNMPYAGRG
ncbi:MAG: SDR family oxidoreductase [Betaproteobacteria bacterium]|jgi:NAD(P)-dependent dehydrogenase (short-subunit alcohol dehydrogenase family)|nr:SDR family oxidoreductase [Betaproteobacteria bacterium]